MYLYFDTEFTYLGRDAELISLGILSDDGKKFYAEFNDFDVKKCTGWVDEHVLTETILYGGSSVREELEGDKDICIVVGTRSEVRSALRDWLGQFDSVQFVSDVAHFDFVLLTDLFGSAFDLPDNVSPSCHDVNQDIARYYGISEKDAFDKDREVLCGIKSAGKHNAMHDAEIVKWVFKTVKGGT